MSKRTGASPNENIAPSCSTMDDNEATSSLVPAKRPRLIEERIAVAGRVASVRLINFMCHANLQIDFRTKENNCFYIGGPNGSGKSALFAAINLGLGGRGSDNDRGNTVKSYIKDGTQQAKITITLTNEGLNSHPDFDELISVERTINQTSSTYIMKSIKVASSGQETERVISKKKTDIDRIVSRFNIHLSNPAFWMSQDRSRSFLANFKPASVYKLYLESTNLENIRQSYVRFAASIEDCADIAERKTSEVSIEQRKLKRMQEQRELQARLEDDEELSRVYMWKLLFCKVRDYDDEILLNKKKQECHIRLQVECKNAYANNRAARNVVQTKIQDVGDEVDVQTGEVAEAKTQLKEAMSAVQVFQEEIQGYTDQQRRKKKDIASVERLIAQAEDKYRMLLASQGNGQVSEKLKSKEREYRQLRQERENMEMGNEPDRLKEEIEMLKGEESRTREKAMKSSNALRKMNEKFKDLQRELECARAAKDNSVNIFGPCMATILRKINERQSEFDKLPKGPIGQFVTLSDPQWALAVEQCFKNIIKDFICHSQKDAAILRDIINRIQVPHDQRPTIHVSHFSGRCYDNLQEPNTNEFKTMYRTLKISDPDVSNLIIDKTGCEQFILLVDKTDAMNIMGSKNPPQHAKRAWTPEAAQAFAGGPNGQYRFYTGNGARVTGVFNAKRGSDEQVLSRDYKDVEKQMRIDYAEHKKLEAEVKEYPSKIIRLERDLEQFDRKLRQLRNREDEAQHYVEELKREIAQSSNEEKLTEMADTIDELKTKNPESQQEIKDLQEKIEDVKAKMRPALAAQEEAQTVYNELQTELKELSARAHKLHSDMSSFDAEGDVYKIRLDKLRAEENKMFHDEARLKTERDEAVSRLEEEKKVTLKPAGQEDPPDLSDFPMTEAAKKKLAELEKTIARAREGCDMSITMDTVKEFKEKLAHRRYSCRLLQDAVKNLRSVHEARCKTYPSLKKYTEMKVCDKFRELLEVRGHFIGGLEFDHDKETLNVNVQSCKEKDPMADRQPEEQEEPEEEEEEEDAMDSDDSDDGRAPRRKKAKKQPKKKKNRDLKGLSGGERSFVTAALVMSLWEVMEQPFRMLDEFDVFMDMMNRKLVMDLLVELATQKFPHNQFIFFTPQGIKELKIVDGLQVFEMNKVRD